MKVYEHARLEIIVVLNEIVLAMVIKLVRVIWGKRKEWLRNRAIWILPLGINFYLAMNVIFDNTISYW